MKNIKYLLLISLLGITISGCSSLMTSKDTIIYNTNNNYKETVLSTNTEDNPLTVKEVVAYLKTCKEHYPLSDEFIERYQQYSGGYLTYAKNNNIVIDKQMHSPNQKWHFLHSWLDQSLMEKPSILEADGKQRCYTNLLCPELLLWIFEACNVEHSKLLDSMKVAEYGKSNGLSTTKIASNMKEVVSWDDVKKGIVKTDIIDSDYTHNVIINGADVINLKSTYVRAEKVIIKLEDDSKEISSISSSIVGDYFYSEDDTYYFYMPDCDVDIDITIKDKPSQTLVVIDKFNVGVSKTYELKPSLSYGTGTFSYFCDDNTVATVDNNGLVSGIKEGTCNITVTCNENTLLSKVVNVNVKEVCNTDSLYNCYYDLGVRKTSKLLESANEVFGCFSTNDTKIITKISDFSYIYGGGSGGKSDTAWQSNKMIKFGTTSVNSYCVFELSEEVNTVKITGYVNSQSLKLRIGDNSSNDWTSDKGDNKTTSTNKTNLPLASKDSIEKNMAETITLTFEPTTSLRIATINTTSSKHVLFMSSIEFIYDDTLSK